MTTTELEGNRLIHLFMRGENSFFHDDYIKDHCKYHSDWNQLMKVVEKIEAMGYETEIYSYKEYGNSMVVTHPDWINDIEAKGKTKKDAVLKTVIKFINWYNTQPK